MSLCLNSLMKLDPGVSFSTCPGFRSISSIYTFLKTGKQQMWVFCKCFLNRARFNSMLCVYLLLTKHFWIKNERCFICESQSQLDSVWGGNERKNLLTASVETCNFLWALQKSSEVIWTDAFFLSENVCFQVQIFSWKTTNQPWIWIQMIALVNLLFQNIAQFAICLFHDVSLSLP